MDRDSTMVLLQERIGRLDAEKRLAELQLEVLQLQVAQQQVIRQATATAAAQVTSLQKEVDGLKQQMRLMELAAASAETMCDVYFNRYQVSYVTLTSLYRGELLLYYMNAMLSTYSHFVFDSEFMGRYGITRVWVYWSMPPARGSPPSAPFPRMPPLPPGPPYPPYANGLGDTKTVRQRLMLELLSSDTAAADGAVDSEGDYLGQQGTGSGDGGGSGAAVAATRSGGGRQSGVRCHPGALEPCLER
eukprot:XP_001691717.1 predicted protein [Chlamydomonas reinhardtii]